MKIIRPFLLILAFGVSIGLNAQMKIGYTNLELLVSYLPEAEQVTKQLETYQLQLTKKLEAKKNYFDVKYQEYTEKAQEPDATAASLAPLEQELQRLQEELQTSVAKSEQDLAQRQSELMQPIMEKVQKEFEAFATENGYTYIFNIASTGSSILLHAPDSDNVTEALIGRLGIEIPQD